MKKSFKILLTMVMVILLFSLTAVVSSALTLPTEDTMRVNEIDGTNLPLQQLNGLPEDIYIYDGIVEGDYTVFVGEIETEDSYIGVIAYSENGIDFEYVYDTDVVAASELANYADAGVYCWDTPTYEDGYCYFPAYFYIAEYDEYVDCKVKTADFETWECSADGTPAYDYGEYIGEYNGIHIVDCGWYSVDNEYYISYAISEDGINWTEKEILVETKDEADYEDSFITIQITADGVFFGFYGGMIEDADEGLISLGPVYYVTQDFETVNKVDLPNSDGVLHYDGSGYARQVDLVVANIDNKPIFVITFYSFQLDFETYELNINSSATRTYLFDEENNKLIDDIHFNDASQVSLIAVTENKYFIWSYNIDDTVTLYKRDADSFTMADCKGLSISELQLVYDIDQESVDNAVSIAFAMGVEEYCNLLVTMDEFDNIFKFNIPYDYAELVHWSKSDGMYIYTETYLGEDEYEHGYYHITAEELYNYVIEEVSANAPSSNYTGLFKYNGTWYYAKNGTIDLTFTGLHKHTNGIWYYIEDGILDWGFNGLWKHNGVWYGLQKGQINWKYTALVKHTNGIWYYVKNAKLNWGYTGLVKHNTGSWFYVQKGQINFDYTGLVKHTNGIWYYINHGKLDWSFTGLVKHNGVWYGLVNGQIDWKFVGLIQHTNGIWYYVENGKLNWGYTGLLSCDDGYTYYIQKGQVNFDYSGYITYEGKRYRIVNGVVV